MEDIDKSIAEFKIQNQIDDYLYKNIYPDFSLKRKDNKNNRYYCSKKKTNDYTDLIYDTNIQLEKINRQDYINFENISKKLENIENEIIDINNIQRENIINENNNNTICPICIEPIGNKSYLMMKCNHSICGSCCYHNFTKNNHTGLLCPMCRTHLL